GGGHGNADAAAGARVAVRHVGGALFVAHKDMMKLGFAESVIDRQDRTAGVAKDVKNAQPGKRFAQDFRASELHEDLETVCAAEASVLGTVVTAPIDEDETSSAYLAMTPFVNRGVGVFQVESRRWISRSLSFTLSVRLGMSKIIVSPSAIAA